MPSGVSCRNVPFLAILIGVIVVVAILLTIPFLFHNKLRSVFRGAVASNAPECAGIGEQILRDGGSAADVAIAVMVCEAVTCPESSGLGGGFVLTYYHKESDTVEVLDARPVAPKAAHKDMLKGVDEDSLSYKALSVGVPGSVKGYWELHKRYGKLPWNKLIEPSIRLCVNGFNVTNHLGIWLKKMKNTILSSTSLRERFVNPYREDVWTEGEVITDHVLAETLDSISLGEYVLYSENGPLLANLIDDLSLFGSILRKEDFTEYSVKWSEPVSMALPEQKTLYSPDLPEGGPLLVHILKVLESFEDLILDEATSWHRMVEAFKFAFGASSHLGDPDFHPILHQLSRNLTNEEYAHEIRRQIMDDRTFNDTAHYGAVNEPVRNRDSSHISVLTPDGDAVSVTSSINENFGSTLRSPRTGIILNNALTEFTDAAANQIQPKKRPMRSACPTIVVDNSGHVRLVVGSAGGTSMITSTAQVIYRHVLGGQPLRETLLAPRVHHRLVPMDLLYEKTLPEEIVSQLAERGHKLVQVSRIGSVTAISSTGDGKIWAAYDPRRSGGAIAVYDREWYTLYGQ
ncbi:glutathione hydrolase 1 proenzyme-like [Uranotaenia lowii]|uniref:glutathione hydrolase 1 proenzyme-like n=1 Tax=Uranotaenia lowii TaxID=190385 RepID=UPI0024783943|nr:glutathione hydrolase 1 proenzyme-like [Uranotaenia lowii]